MSLIFHFLLLTLSTTTSFPLPLPLWPKPTSLSWPNHTFTHLSPTFRLHLPSTPHPSLLSSSHHYTHLLLSTTTTLPHHPISTTPSSPPLHSLTITVRNLSSPLHPACDESYSLSLHPPSATLVSASPWGALHGLATLSQLAFFDPATRSILIPAGLVIEDRPMFGHRGLLLDTSRNFYPVQDLMRTVEAMAWNKMNVFHWHITDSQSFPVTLQSEPELARKGAYGPDMVYSVEDVRRVVEFGFERGVRVVPEFDAPGHTASWAGAYPEIVTCANRFWAPPDSEPLAAEPGTGQLNPLHPKTYEVYLNVLRDAADLFPDPFMHAGADEVSPGCWKTDQAIQSFLSNNGTLSQLLEIFINTTHPYIAEELHRTVVYWEDVLLGDKVRVDPSILPPESTVLQTWNNGPNNTKRIVESGYRVIVSSADFYYLDCGHGGFVGNDSRYDQQIDDPSLPPFNYLGGNGGSWCGPFKTWQRIYDYDITYGLTKEEAKLVLGGEVALWSEQADPTVLDSRLWPRASAMAESLWSGNRYRNGKKRYAEATDRLNQWRNRMVARGANAEPIQPLWCLYHPGMCNLVQ